MSEYYLINDMVEGAHCNICTKKESWGTLQKEPVTNKSMLKCTLSRDCCVEITKALIFTDQEKSEKKKKHIFHDVGDKVRAEGIIVYIDQKRRLQLAEVRKSSGQHEARLFYSKVHTIAKITYPFQHILAVTKQISADDQKLLNT